MGDVQPAADSDLVLFTKSEGRNAAKLSRLCLAQPSAGYPRSVDVAALAKGIHQTSSLQQVELSRCGLQQPDVVTLAQVLSANRHVDYLGLSRNPCATKEGSEALSEALKTNQILRTLDLAWSNATDETAGHLAEMLLVNNSLQRLLLDRNRISCDGANALATALGSNRKLKHLSLSQNRLRAAGLSFLGRAAARSVTLAVLDVSMNGIAEPGLCSLFHALADAHEGSALTTLNVGYNCVGKAVAMAGVLLAKNRTLRELNLDGTHIEPGAHFHSFACNLAKNRSLVHLSLAANPIGDDGMASLEKAFCSSSISSPSGPQRPLRLLNVSACEFGVPGAQSLASMAEMGAVGNLSTIILSANRQAGGEAGGVALARIAALPSLRTLVAGDIGLGAAGVDAFLARLKEKPSCITGLSLRTNDIGVRAACTILQYCRARTDFVFIDLSDNKSVAESVFKASVEALAANRSLVYVALDETTVVDRRCATDAWPNVRGKRTADDSLPPPPGTDAPWDYDPTRHRPSIGFSSYSVGVGSAVRRYSEELWPLTALLLSTGMPVKHVALWRGSQRTAPAVTLKNHRFNYYLRDAAAAEYENNVGGMLITDDQLRREFNRLDANGNGFIDTEEMKLVYSSLEHFGVKYTPQDLSALMKEAADNVVTFDHFCVLYLGLVRR